MAIKTIATIDCKHPADLGSSLLPVLKLCGVKDQQPSFVNALCVDVHDGTIDFWVTNTYTIFVSSLKVENAVDKASATIRPSRFGLFAEHLKKAKRHLSIIFQHNEDCASFELVIASENGSITVGDESIHAHPNKQKTFDMFEHDQNHTLVPGQVIFSPKQYLPILNAFKGVEHIDIQYSSATRQMRIQTAVNTPFVKFDALVAGCQPSVQQSDD